MLPQRIEKELLSWPVGLFDFSNDFERLIRGSEGGALPMDIFEDDQRYLLKFDVPGLVKSEIEISFDQNVLTIEFERKRERREKGESEPRALVAERWHGKRQRSIRLPAAAVSGEVQASLNDGVLTVEVRKRPEKQAKKVEIN